MFKNKTKQKKNKTKLYVSQSVLIFNAQQIIDRSWSNFIIVPRFYSLPEVYCQYGLTWTVHRLTVTYLFRDVAN